MIEGNENYAIPMTHREREMVDIHQGPEGMYEECSQATNELDAALAKAQGEFPPIHRTKTALVRSEKGNYSFDYSPLDEVIDAVRPSLSKHGLSVKSLVAADKDHIRLTTKLSHSSGQFEKTTILWQRPLKVQEFGSALTYLRRYSLCGILNISADSDDDGNASDGNSRTVQGRGKSNGAAEKPATISPPPEDKTATNGKPSEADYPELRGNTHFTEPQKAEFRRLAKIIDDEGKDELAIKAAAESVTEALRKKTITPTLGKLLMQRTESRRTLVAAVKEQDGFF